MTPRGKVVRKNFVKGYEFIYREKRWIVQSVDCQSDRVECVNCNVSVDKLYEHISVLITKSLADDQDHWGQCQWDLVTRKCKGCDKPMPKYVDYEDWRDTFFTRVIAKLDDQALLDVVQLGAKVVEERKEIPNGPTYTVGVDIGKREDESVAVLLATYKPPLFSTYTPSETEYAIMLEQLKGTSLDGPSKK